MISVRYTKWDGSLHWHFEVTPLGEDEHGVWVGGHADTVFRRGDEPPVQLDRSFAGVFPPAAGYTAWFNSAGEAEVYVDVTTVPVWSGDGRRTVTMVDLDLDVIRRRDDGRVVIDDEDEFAEHQVKYRYPAEVVAAAEETASRLVRALTDRVEPFRSVGERWLRGLL